MARMTIAALAFLVLVWAGCQTPLDRAYSRSHSDYVERSIENPEAGGEDSPELDAASTTNAMYKYRKQERTTPEDESKSIINVDID
ncbi:MAG: hypothetical protein AAF430_12945 [Myxococcota bacterium]